MPAARAMHMTAGRLLDRHVGLGIAAAIARVAGRRQTIQVILPQGRLLRAQLVQVGPGVQAGIVAIAESRLHGVVADRLDARDADQAFS